MPQTQKIPDSEEPGMKNNLAFVEQYAIMAVAFMPLRDTTNGGRSLSLLCRKEVSVWSLMKPCLAIQWLSFRSSRLSSPAKAKISNSNSFIHKRKEITPSHKLPSSDGVIS